MSGWHFDPELRDRLSGRLSRFSPQSEELAGRSQAAVVLLVLPNATGQASLVLTRRSLGLRRHRGQWALPGGRIDPGEGAREAAFRELKEELGVDLPEQSLLGQLDDYPTRSGWVIRPFVLWGEEGCELQPDPGEVAAVHLASFEELARPKAPLIQRLPLSSRPLLALRILGTVIFSPTAAMVYQFREVALKDRPTRVGHYDQPRFAWK